MVSAVSSTIDAWKWAASWVAPIWLARWVKPLSNPSTAALRATAAPRARRLSSQAAPGAAGEHRRGDRRQLRIQLRRQRDRAQDQIRMSGCDAAQVGSAAGADTRHARAPLCPDRRADSTSRPVTRRRRPAIAGPARTGRRAGHRITRRCAAGRPAPGRRLDRPPRRCGPAASAAPDPPRSPPARTTRRADGRFPAPRHPRSGWWG